jgi:hypothetical protein
MRKDLEGGEFGGRFEPKEVGLGEGLRTNAELMGKAIERGEDYRANERPIIEALREFVENRLESVINVVGSLKEAVDHAGPLLGEFGPRISEGLGRAHETLQRGFEWLKEHPEVFEATLQLVVIGAVAVYAPSAVAGLLSEQPEILLGPLRVIAGHAIA